MGFKILGNLHVVVVGEKDPTAADWKVYVDALKAEEKKGIDVTKMRTLVFSDGGGPNAAQRKVVADLLNGRSTLLAITTGSTIMRGVITALRWFNPQCRAFAPDEVGDALKFLDVPELQYDMIVASARQLQSGLKLPPVKSLDAARLRRALTSAARP